MEGKVIYLTNVDRRFFMMRKACSELKREGLVPAEYETLKVESTSLWSRIWEKQLGDADLVMIRFMGTTIRTMFWDKCLAFFAAKSIPYYMDAAGSAEEEARNGVSVKRMLKRLSSIVFTAESKIIKTCGSFCNL